MSDPTRSLPPASLSEVIGGYLEAVDEGSPPDPEELIGRYPEFAADLRGFLAAQGAFEKFAAPFCPGTPYRADAETVDAFPELPRGADEEPVPAVSSGEYALREEVGRGGMGAVYRARDDALGRDIAVKVLQERLRDDPASALRFLAEARVTAELAHPGIPPVHALGTLADGRPFLAMKLIDGHTLDELLSNRPDLSSDRGRLLGVFEQVCQAVAFAHAKCIIHRDLKPSNVMVGRFGETLVLDWGLAKVVRRGGRDAHDEGPADDDPARAPEPVGRTAAGSVLGTPAFMPPEQAAGDLDELDERADVFGLGAVLCTILTGQPPYTGETTEEVHGKAKRADLGDCFARLDSCGADAELVAVAKRCLAPEPADRYADGEAVAQAVAAYRAGVDERLRRAERDRAAAEARAAEQRKRRKVQLVLAAVVLLLVSGAGAFAWWQDKQATERRIEEGERRGRNDAAIAALIERCETALRADDADAAADALREAERRLHEGGGEPYVDRLARCRRDLELLRALDRADDLLWAWEHQSAPARRGVDAWRKAFELAGAPLGPTPPAAVARLVEGSLVRDRLLAALDMLLVLGRSEDALAALRAVDPDPFRDEFRAAVLARDDAQLRTLAARPDALRQPDEFTVMTGYAQPVPAARRNEILRDAYHRRPDRLPVVMALAGLYPHNQRAAAEERVGWYRAAVALRPRNGTVWNKLGIALRDRGAAVEAETAFRTALEQHPEMVMGWVNLGTALSDQGRRNEALACAREALRLDPANAFAHFALGTGLQAVGDLDGAIASLRAAVRLDTQLAIAHSNLGVVLGRKGDRAASVACAREAVRLDPSDAGAYFNLGSALQAGGDVPGALVALREGVRLDPMDPRGWTNLGAALEATGDRDGAIDALREALRLDPKLAAAHSNLGLALARKGDLKAALKAHREAVRLAPEEAKARFNLGSALQAGGDIPAAFAEFRVTVRLDPTFAPAHSNLGILLAGTGDLDGAIACYREAVRHDPKFVPGWLNLGSALTKKRDARGAVAAYEKAVAIDPTVVASQARPIASAYFNLGLDLRRAGDESGAITAYRTAIRHNTNLAQAHVNLGAVLEDCGDTDGALECYRTAIEVGPGEAMAHYNLAYLRALRGETEGVVAGYREAVRLNPSFAQAWCNLGHALRDRGELAEALKCLKRGHELGSRQPGWPYSSDRWVRECEELVRQDARLADILAGAVKPRTAAEALTFARVCGYRNEHAAAVRFYEDAFAKESRLAAQYRNGLRSRVAAHAVLAAGDRVGLRRQALDWLRADLATWTKAATATPASRPAAFRAMTDWLADRSFARVRHPLLLTAIPPDEAKAWLALWAEVRDLRDRTAPPPTAPFPKVKPAAPPG